MADNTLPFTVEGITWHALTLDPQEFDNIKDLVTKQFGTQPMMELEGVTVFQFPNDTLLELYTLESVPTFGYNGSVAFGYRVSDIEAASQALADEGYELLGEITRVEEMKYAYRHFRAKDGKVYGLNEQK